MRISRPRDAHARREWTTGARRWPQPNELKPGDFIKLRPDNDRWRITRILQSNEGEPIVCAVPVDAYGRTIGKEQPIRDAAIVSRTQVIRPV